MSEFQENDSLGAIAIIGMSGRFPGAKDMEEFWENLKNGVESVKFFNRDELIKLGIDEHLLDNPKFVAADAILEDMDKFDAAFFDYSAREAEIMDPQHRLFLESAWEVMESAGYNSELYDGRVAVYAGANLSGYMIRNLYSNPGLVENVGTFKIMIANSQDFLATKVSYKMNLMGPSVNVNTLCSSSLVALNMACQNLQNYGCDIALAGGVSFQVSRNEAFFYQEGGIGSSDGHCRAFDSKANGTVSGSGLAVLVLKRLEDAIADGDHIHAVIRGTGMNNDGSNKNSYTAPNVDGQAECIAEAIAISGVNPETITYIDAHGTGTDLGDPIEIAALTKAFRSYTDKKQFCAIGSVKTNIGHLVNAGGLASVVKTVLAMEHKVIPPSLNFEEPNPKIDFVNTPFYVNTELAKWENEDGTPLRAGVSSFGIGGTNTHVILEEAPEIEPSGESNRPCQLICLSAKTATALDKMSENLLLHIKKNPDLNLADAAFTLQVGRRNFNHRKMIVCSDIKELQTKLEKGEGYSKFQKTKELPVVFMFPGEGSGYANMGYELYKAEPAFADIVDKCSEILQPILRIDLHKALYGKDELPEDIVRATTFVTEYAMAKLWMSWEVNPQHMIGGGLGEIVAACIAEVFSLEDALKLVTAPDEELPNIIGNMTLNSPNIPFISCVSGYRIREEEAVSPQYWLRQCQGMKAIDGLKEILKDADQILLEIGPGTKMTNQAKEINQEESIIIISTMPELNNPMSDVEYLLNSLGHFWLAGGRVNWKKLYEYEKRHRIPLPTYPFERQRYWIEPGKRSSETGKFDVLVNKEKDINEEIINSEYKEGSITLKFNMDKAKAHGSSRKQLEAMMKFRDALEELAREYSDIVPDIEISPVGLKSEKTLNSTDSKLNKMPRPDMEVPYTAPRNDVEAIIAEKWQETLGFDKIGVYDDFFELGGHSLIAAAVATELSKVFDVQIPMRKLFETTRVADIAELIESYRTYGLNEAEANEEEMEAGTI